MSDNEIKKLDMKSTDIVNKNIEKIGELFPNAISEGKIDFEVLKQELSNNIIDDKKEKYQLSWAGKNNAIIEYAKRTHKTLCPKVEESVNFYDTKNIYIEGDNLEVLKILQESYLNKIKCIYIDPPYNTGNDFIYNDDFKKKDDEELYDAGNIDKDGNYLISNPKSNGRFHSDWLSMMYSRLKLARNLLANDGVIFISIDDNEYDNLKKMCDEIFGENNFIANSINITGATQNGDGVKIQRNFEYLLCYAKSYDTNNIYHVDKADESLRSLADAPSPLYTRKDMGYTIYYNPSTNDIVPKFDYDKTKIELNDEKLIYKDDLELISKGYVPIRPGKKDNYLHRWRWGFDTFIERKDEIIINKNRNGDYTVSFKQKGYNPPKNILNFAVGTTELKNLFDGIKIFDYPKSVKMIKRILEISTSKNDIILDFFSGSATTAHACMQLNSEDSGNRKFILVQLPEKCDENSDAYKSGYKTICDIGEERIRRAANKIKEETNADIDYGFRVYKVDSSNMKDVYYEPSKLGQEQLNMFESNIKEDRTSEDLLTQVILDLGLTLDLIIEEKNILGNTVYFVAKNSLVACFDSQINIDIIDKICEVKPLKIVFRESSFKNDSDKINTYERIKKICPETEVNII